MLFLGTGAAELIPNPFCECETCRNARQNRDPRDLRRRSALLLDAENLIDFGPDVPYACGAYGISLSKLKNVFLTHLHLDHFSLSSFEELTMTETEPPRLNVFLSPEAYSGLARMRGTLEALDYAYFDLAIPAYLQMCDFLPVQPYTEYEAGGMRFSATPGNHGGLFKDERSLHYLFTQNGKQLYYALDTGLLPEESYAYLQNRRIDTLVIEATYGACPIEADETHLNLDSLERVIERLRKISAIKEESRIVLTHIGMKGRLDHAAYSRLAKERLGVHTVVAYDGMELPF